MAMHEIFCYFWPVLIKFLYIFFYRFVSHSFFLSIFNRISFRPCRGCVVVVYAIYKVHVSPSPAHNPLENSTFLSFPPFFSIIFGCDSFSYMESQLILDIQIARMNSNSSSINLTLC